jgi:hypothetical protein
MTTKEFSDAFDTLLSSYNTNGDFGYTSSTGALTLDEYEKSLFLTQAQEQLVIELYTGRNSKASSFEETEEARANLRSLIRTAALTESSGYNGISKYSKFFVLPEDVLFITYESATLDDDNAGCKKESEIPIIPVTQDEFHSIINNPFRGLSKRRALRLDNGLDVVEIVTKYNIKNYTVRYISKPTPIVLSNFFEESGDGVSIDGVSEITECELDSVMHRDILKRAVALAIASRSIQNKGNV